MEGKSKTQSKKSSFTTQYTNLLHLLCEGHLYFAFTTNIFNKAKALLFSTSHGVLTLLLMVMLLLPLTVFVICHPIWESGWNKIKGIQFLQSNDIQELPGPEYPGAAAEIHWKTENRTEQYWKFGEEDKIQQDNKSKMTVQDKVSEFLNASVECKVLSL